MHLHMYLRKYLRTHAIKQVLAHVCTCASSWALTHLSKYLRTYELAQVVAHLRIYASICALAHWDFVILNRQKFIFQMEAHSVGPVDTLTYLSVGLKLYHCLRRDRW